MMENPNQSGLNLNTYWLTFWKSKGGMDFKARVIKLTDLSSLHSAIYRSWLLLKALPLTVGGRLF